MQAARVKAEDTNSGGVQVNAPGPGTETTPAIWVEDLRKVYGEKVAVEGLTLEVGRGEVFGFLGPNGAGKTTTIKMMNGLVRPTAGRMSILGRPLGDPEARRRIGFLPEQFRFHEWLRAEEFLDFHGSLYGLPRSERKRRIPEALKLVGLDGRARSRLKTFSKGMLQRIGIAQAVIADPLLVFLDEPTSALDPLGRRDVRDIIRTLQGRGVTVFLNSHLLGEVESVCDRVAIVKQGRVAALGPVSELLGGEHVVELRASKVSGALLAELGARYTVLGGGGQPDASGAPQRGAAPNPDAGVAGDGVGREPGAARAAVAAPPGGGDDARTLLVSLPVEETPALVTLLVRGGACLYELTPRRRSLEDLFVDIVQVGGDR
jgi:ABC-2 type transport system ATP-binding protein